MLKYGDLKSTNNILSNEIFAKFSCRIESKYIDSTMPFVIQVRHLLGDTVLRGEELKKYVNSLRTKSTVYKRQRANLSTFKVSVVGLC